MIRKTAILLLLFVYLLPAIGVQASVHFCGGEISSIALFNKTEPCCCKSTKQGKYRKMPSDCCDTKTVQVKNTENQIPASFESSFKAPLIAVLKMFVLPNTTINNASKKSIFSILSLWLFKPKLYLSFNAFLFYE